MEEYASINGGEDAKRQQWQDWYDEFAARINKMISEETVLGECPICHQTVVARRQVDIEAWEGSGLCARCEDEGLMTCERRGC